MSIIISILLAFLPKLLAWLIDLFNRGQTLSGKQLAQLDRITWYAAQIAGTSPKVGCRVGGVPPE